MNALTTPKQLREQADRYERAANKLREAADAIGGDVEQQIEKTPRKTAENGDNATVRGKRGSRLPALKGWLEKHGPAKRRSIVEGTGIPVGTVATLLREANGLTHHDDGSWSVR